jgi:hypothetical protein
MTAYHEEPKTVEEMLARYREVRRRLYPPIRQRSLVEFTARDAESVIASGRDRGPAEPGARVRSARRTIEGKGERGKFAQQGAGCGLGRLETDRRIHRGYPRSPTHSDHRLRSPRGDLARATGDGLVSAPGRQILRRSRSHDHPAFIAMHGTSRSAGREPARLHDAH